MPFTTHLTSKIAAFNTNEEDGETKAGTDLPFVSPANTTASNKSLPRVYLSTVAQQSQQHEERQQRAGDPKPHGSAAGLTGG